MKKYKYPVLLLVIGMLILLLPPISLSDKPETGSELQQALQQTEGVGEVCVIVSEHGAVVVCSGADSAKVKLDVIRAVSAYTGFGSDKITVLKNVD